MMHITISKYPTKEEYMRIVDYKNSTPNINTLVADYMSFYDELPDLNRFGITLLAKKMNYSVDRSSYMVENDGPYMSYAILLTIETEDTKCKKEIWNFEKGWSDDFTSAWPNIIKTILRENLIELNDKYKNEAKRLKLIGKLDNMNDEKFED